MNKIIIDVPDHNDSFSRVVLSGTAYLIRFTYNDTFDYWTFGLYDTQENPIVTGIKMVPNYPLNLFCDNDQMPFGIFAIYTDLEKVGRAAFLDGKADFCFIPGEVSR